MTGLPNKTKRKILSGFVITGNIKICCIRYGFNDMHNEFNKRHRENPSYKSKQKFYNALAVETKITLHSLFKDFLIKNGLSLEDIKFEVDNEIMWNILKCSGLKPIEHPQNHKLADCIVHANYKNWDVTGVEEYNDIKFKNKICERVLKKCFR